MEKHKEKKPHDSTLAIASLVFEDPAIDTGGGDQINSVPTTSRHMKKTAAFLNRYLTEHPERTNTVYALLTYSTQKWASQARSRMELDVSSSENLEKLLISTANESLKTICEKTGIRPQVGDKRLMRIEKSDELISCIEEAVDWLEDTPKLGRKWAKTIRAIHFCDGTEDISHYIFNATYRDALDELHRGYGDRINDYVCQLSGSKWLFEGNFNSTAYHNTLMLLQLYPQLIHRLAGNAGSDDRSDLGIQRDADSLGLLEPLEKAVNVMETCPATERDRRDMVTILRLIMDGCNTNEIRLRVKISNDSFFRKTTRAVNLLSFILWGYSTEEILEGIVFTPLTRKDIKKII